MIGFRPQPSAGGTGGGGGSYDDTAIRKRISDNEILDGVQNAAIEALEDASAGVAGRVKALEDAPAPAPFDPAPLVAADAAVAERVAALEAVPAPTPFDPAPLIAADADLVRRIGAIEGRPEPVPFDDTALRGRVKALEDAPAPTPFDPAPLIAADVGFDRRIDVLEVAGAQIEDRVDILEKAPAPAPYDDAALIARVKTLEDAPKPTPFDPAPLVAADTALGERIGAAETAGARAADRITALESVPIPPAFDPSSLEAADAALGRRIDTLSAEGYDDTALSGRVKALEDAPEPVPYDDAALRGRVTDLEARPVPAPFDPSPLEAADAALGARIDALSESGGSADVEEIQSDITRLTGIAFNHGVTLGEHDGLLASLRTDVDALEAADPFDPAPLIATDNAIAQRVSTLEAAPAPVPYDDAALRGRVTDLEARPVFVPFDPAPLVAADADLARRIGVIEDRPAAPAFDDAALRQADADLNIALGGLRVDLGDIENGYFRKGLRPGQSVQGQAFPASLSTLGDLGLSSAGDLRIYVLDDFDAVLAVHAITARPADQIADYLTSFPAGLRASRLVVDGNAHVNVEADPEVYPTGRVAIEYGPVPEMLGLYRGPVAALDDRFDAIGSGGGATYDDGPLTRRVVALEEKPSPAPFDPSALEAADQALGDRIDALGSGGPGLRRLSSVRRIASNSWLELRSIAPERATHFRVTAVGGGASGVAPSYSGSGAAPATAHGGLPGYVRSSELLPMSETTWLGISVGSGGSAVSGSAVNSGGGSTSVEFKRPDQSTWATLTAPGGDGFRRYASIQPTSPADVLRWMAWPLSVLSGGGSSASTFASFANSGPDAVDAPTGGAGASNGSGQQGSGGTVRYTTGKHAHGQSETLGGTGAASSTPAKAGVSAPLNVAGLYGSGGGGGGYINSGLQQPGGDGGFPGGGGGGSMGGAASGRGGDGCVDIEFFG